MANMNYVRFENTLSDLRDCKRALSNGEFDDLSESEQEAAIELIRMCESIYANNSELID